MTVLSRTPLGERALNHAAKSLPQDIAVIIAMTGHGVERQALAKVGLHYASSFEQSIDKTIRLGLIAVAQPDQVDAASLPSAETLSARFSTLLELALGGAKKNTAAKGMLDGAAVAIPAPVTPSSLTETTFLRRQIEHDVDFDSFQESNVTQSQEHAIVQQIETATTLDVNADTSAILSQQRAASSPSLVSKPESIQTQHPPELTATEPAFKPAISYINTQSDPKAVFVTHPAIDDVVSAKTDFRSQEKASVKTQSEEPLPPMAHVLSHHDDDQPLTAQQLDELDAQDQEHTKSLGVSKPLSYIPANPLAPIFSTDELDQTLIFERVSNVPVPATHNPLPSVTLVAPEPSTPVTAAANTFAKTPIQAGVMPSTTDRKNAQALALELRATQRLGAMVVATQGRQTELQERLKATQQELEQLQHGLAEAQYERANSSRGLDEAISAVAQIREQTRERQSELLSAQTQLDGSKRSLLAIKNENAYLELQRVRLLKDQDGLSEQVRVIRERTDLLKEEARQLKQTEQALQPQHLLAQSDQSFEMWHGVDSRFKYWALFATLVLCIVVGLAVVFSKQYMDANKPSSPSIFKVDSNASKAAAAANGDNGSSLKLSPMQKILLDPPHPYENGLGVRDTKTSEADLRLRTSDRISDLNAQ